MAEKACRYQKAAFAALGGMGFEVFRPPMLTRSSQEAVAHIRQLEDAGVECLLMYVAEWSFSTTAAIGILRSVRLPIVLWTNDQPDSTGLIGAAITKGGLDEVGVAAPLVYGDFDDAPTLAEVKTLCIGAAAAARLRGMRYGLGGTRSLEMLTASIDPNAWLTQFGVDVDGWDEIDVVERTHDVDSAKVELYRAWLAREFGGVQVSAAIVDMSARLYLALKQVIAEKRFDFISVKCLPTMAKVYTSFCLPHALLGDASDAEGPKERMICACESDSNGALTMQMMKNVNDQAINFADVRNLDLKTNTLRISNCGSSATELAGSRKEVIWVKHGLQELPWKHGAMCPQCVSRPGRITMARLSRIAGRYVMLITGGEALAKSREALKDTYWEFSPHMFIRPDVPGKTFVANLRSNHIHTMYGEWRKELVHLCRVLGIEPIVPEGTLA
ncbi:MAG: hypothetical protein PHE83_11720 [Opitutaceae bacterium]|nr:hypothetical protein [Opitutaceae bacterium]